MIQMKTKLRDAMFQSKQDAEPKVHIVEDIEFNEVIHFTDPDDVEVFTSPKGNRIACIIDSRSEVIMVEYRRD
jgi:hypothetical protein